MYYYNKPVLKLHTLRVSERDMRHSERDRRGDVHGTRTPQLARQLRPLSKRTQ